jgi:hypothetical protein
MLRPIAAGLLAMTILGATQLAATAASAHTYFVGSKEVKGTEIFKAEGTNGIVNSKEEVGPNTGGWELESKIGGVEVLLRCAAGKMKDEIEKEGLSKAGESTYEVCGISEIKEGKDTALKSCTVPTVHVKMKDSVIAGAGGAAEVEFQPSSGKLLGEVEITGSSCSIKGTYKLETATEGKGQICSAVGGEVEVVRHVLTCSPTGSQEIRLGSEKAGQAYFLTMKLEAGTSWYFE